MTTADFYDRLSPFYHLVYADWEASVRRQALELDAVIRELWGPRVATVLDAACGIGTQAIGLAELGYTVTASDLSAGAVARAQEEAARRSLAIEFGTADLRTLSSSQSKRFDVVIACDNSIPHLLSDGEIRLAFVEMHRCTAPGGGALISVRDYDPADSSGTKVVPFGLRTDGDRRHLVFQVWDFHGSIYDLSMYFVEDRGGLECTGRVMRAQYYAIPVARLIELMSEAGFRDVRRIDRRYFQPLIAGSKPAGS
jgi:SAM-dependent methyltransferase